MPTPRQQLILDMFLHRIPKDAFLREIGIEPEAASEFALRMLENAYREQNEVDVECGLGLAFRFGITPEYLDILLRLSDADWHRRHEDVVTALDNLRDPRAIDALYRAALKLHPYLDYDNTRALADKAIWALAELCDATANQKLRSLAESGEPVLEKYAREQLYRKSCRVTPEEKQHGRSLCERIDKENDQVSRTRLLQELHELNERQKKEEDKWMDEHGWKTS